MANSRDTRHGEDDESYGTFEVRVHIDDPPPDNAEDLAAAKEAVHVVLRAGLFAILG